jgi:hypothetical protein
LATGLADASKSAAHTCASFAFPFAPGVWNELGSCALASAGTPTIAVAATNESHAVLTVMKPPAKR